MPNKESIEIEIAKLIVETLSLEDINPSDIDFELFVFELDILKQRWMLT
jgi:acyl carrier protein